MKHNHLVIAVEPDGSGWQTMCGQTQAKALIPVGTPKCPDCETLHRLDLSMMETRA
jgi:hypothetical protein